MIRLNWAVVAAAFLVGVVVALGMQLGELIDQGPADDVIAASAIEAQPSSTVTTSTTTTVVRHTTSLSSTAYCLTTPMANGATPYVGAVAANRYRLGTRLRVDRSPIGPGIFVVTDRSAPGATDIDFAVPGHCDLARAWGRRPVHVEVLHG